MKPINRRDMLKRSAAFAGAVSALSLPGSLLRGADTPMKKVLFFTQSQGFQHSVIDRHGKDEPAYAEKILIDLGAAHGLAVTPSKDGRLFTPEKLAEFDSIVFMTTGDLTKPGTDHQPPMPADGKQTLIDAVAGGKGFVGIHCGSDTFHSKGDQIDPYIAMLGGEFVIHGNQQESTCHVLDTQFPGAPAKDFSFKEEWYSLKNFAPDLHVILMQETKGMQGAMYQRDPYPSTWARMHGKGRVFYTSMGHRDEVWKNPIFTDLLLGGIAWSAGIGQADVAKNT